jgi:ATP-dependent Lon protease
VNQLELVVPFFVAMNSSEQNQCGRTILLVDDDDALAAGMTKLLERNRLRVVRARNGAEALEQLDECEFDLVISDIFMDRMDGLEMLMQMRKCSPNTRVLAISGGNRFGDIDPLKVARHLGAAMVLRKPISATELFRALSELGIIGTEAESVPR